MSPAQFTQVTEAAKSICQSYDLTLVQLTARRRWPELVEARDMLACFAHSIGIHDRQTAALLKQTRTNVIRGRQTFRNRLDTEPKLRQAYEALRKEIVA